MAKLDSILKAAQAKNAECISLSRLNAIRMRLDGQWVVVLEPNTELYVEELISEILAPREREEFLRRQSLTKVYVLAGVGCFSVHVFRSLTGLEAVLRVLPEAAPSTSELNIPQSVSQQTLAARGIFIVQGPDVNRNQLIINALVQNLGQTVARQICLLQTRSSVLLKSEKSILYQREVGQNCPSYEQGIADAAFLGVDVLVLDEVTSPSVAKLVSEMAKTKLVIFGLNAETTFLAEMHWGALFSDSEKLHAQQEFKKHLVSIYMEKTGGTFSGNLSPLSIPAPTTPLESEVPTPSIVLAQKPPPVATPGVRPPPLTKKVG